MSDEGLLVYTYFVFSFMHCRNLVDFILDESDSDDVFLVEDDSDEDDFDDDFEKENKGFEISKFFCYM